MKQCLRIITQLQRCTRLEHLYQLLLENGADVMSEYYNGDIQTVSFNEFGRRTKVMAAGLQQLIGTEYKGHFVGLQAENSPNYPSMFWAILMAGYKPILIDIKATEAQLMNVLEKAGCNTLITECEEPVPSKIKKINPAEMEAFTKTDGFKSSWEDQFALCTSGTTSSSKVYVFNGIALCKQLTATKDLLRGGALRDGNVKVLAFLPLHHVFGLLGTHMCYNLMGKTLVYLPDKKPSTILESCRRHRVTHILAVPLVWNNLAKGVMRKAKLQGEETYQKLVKGIDKSLSLQRKFGKFGRTIVAKSALKEVQASLIGPDIECLISGGGRILPETLKILSGVGYNIFCGFGMTELGISGVELQDQLDIKLSGSIGKAFDCCEYKVVPMDPAKPEVGELFIRTDMMHIGQMIDGKLVPADIDKEGWFVTGDIARMSEDRVWIEGRLKEIIIGESGENVYPDELEEYFDNKLPSVEQYCIFGYAKGDRNEEIAMIVDMQGKHMSPECVSEMADEFNIVNGKLPIYKRVRHLFASDVPLPLANAIKVKRQVLKKMIENDSWNCVEVDVLTKKLKSRKENQTETYAPPTEDHNAAFAKLLGEVKQIFGNVLSLDPKDIDENAHFIYDLGGDSLSSLSVYTAIEEKYGVHIDEGEFNNCATALDATKLLSACLKGVNISQPRKTAARQITKFEQTPEYKELMKRMESEMEKGKNPYFVEHDSALTDTSIVDGKKVLNFASYNYLCLSGHPDTIHAAQQAAEKYGTSASGSRLLAGEKPLHKELEAAIAEMKHTEASIVLVGGHSTNVTFVGNFCNRNDLIVFDALSHNSIIQGCQLSKSDSKPFAHNDCKALENILKANRSKYEKVLIVVEGAYSMDGDIAPLPEIVRLKKEYGCFLMVDEAHSTCVLGKTGGGVDEHFGLAPDDIDIKMGTLSKGLGTCGGYIAGSKALISYLKYSMPGFVFSVGLSPVLAAASLEAIKVMKREPERVTRLHQNIDYFLSAAHKYGFDTCLAKETAIVPIFIGGDSEAFNLSVLLLENGVFVPPAVFPAVVRNTARLRFCVTSNHTSEEIDYALSTLDRLCKEKGYQITRRDYALQN